MKNFVLLFLLLCSCFGTALTVAAQTKESDEIIKVDTNLVSIPVVVNDRNGRYIPNLKQSDFSIFQDGEKQDISFFAAEEEPLNVALLLDTSKSTQDILPDIQDAADDFIRLLKPSDRASIVTFDYQVNTLCPLTSDRRRLEEAIDRVDVGEYAGTVMRDAIDETINRSFANVKGRKAIILLTDGKDAGSTPTGEELLKSLEESDVMIYSVFYDTTGRNNRFGGFGSNRGMGGGMPRDDRTGGMDPRGGIFGRGGNRGMGGGGIFGGGFPNDRQQDRRRQRQQMKNEEAKNYLSEMSETTAGRFYEDANTNLSQTFALIADELKKQYRIGYYPKDETASAADEVDAVHQIKVKVARNDVAIRARSTVRMKNP